MSRLVSKKWSLLPAIRGIPAYPLRTPCSLYVNITTYPQKIQIWDKLYIGSFLTCPLLWPLDGWSSLVPFDEGDQFAKCAEAGIVDDQLGPRVDELTASFEGRA